MSDPGPFSQVARAVAAAGLRTTGYRFPDKPLSEAAWADLLVHSRLQRTVGQLCHAVHHGLLPATTEQIAAADDAHAAAMELCLRLEADLLAAVALLSDGGVEHRVLKGPAYAHLDYPHPALRAFVDIDLLVRSEQYDQAVAILCAAGFRRRYQEVRTGFDRRFGKGVSLRSPSGVRQLDLHRTFVMGPFGLTMDLADLWASGRAFDIGGRQFVALSADQRFLHACYHAAIGNSRPRLVPLRDLAEMLQRDHDPVDIGRVRSVSEKWRADTVVARAVRLAWDTFALEETPLSHWAATVAPSRSEARALAVYLDPGTGYAARSFAAVRVVPGLRGKAAFTRMLVFPDRGYGSGRHSGRWTRWRSAARQILTINLRARRR